MSTQLVRDRLGLNLRYFPTSSLAFSLVQVLLVDFLISTSVMELLFFFPLKTEKESRGKRHFLGPPAPSLASSLHPLRGPGAQLNSCQAL